jgi:hypothetical protein
MRRPAASFFFRSGRGQPSNSPRRLKAPANAPSSPQQLNTHAASHTSKPPGSSQRRGPEHPCPAGSLSRKREHFCFVQLGRGQPQPPEAREFPPTRRAVPAAKHISHTQKPWSPEIDHCSLPQAAFSRKTRRPSFVF